MQSLIFGKLAHIAFETRIDEVLNSLAFILMGSFAIAYASSSYSGSMPMPKKISVNGIDLKYVEQGTGEPVVFVHGSNSDYRTWEPQRESISKHYRFIALSMRYFGDEPWLDNGEKFSVETHADDLVEFIRKTTSGPVHLVGWSYSGSVILTVAVRHPDLIKSLFLFEPSVPSIVEVPLAAKEIKEDRAAMVKDGLAAAKLGNNATAVRLFMDAANDKDGSFDALPEEAHTMMLENAKMLPLLLLAPPAPPLTCAQLKQLKFPVAILRGELARTFYKVIAVSMAECISGSQLTVVSKGRHLWPVADPQAFTEMLMKFLNSVEKAR